MNGKRIMSCPIFQMFFELFCNFREFFWGAWFSLVEVLPELLIYHIMFAYFLKGIWAAVDILLSYWVTMSCVQSIVFTCKLQTKGPKCEQCIWCCLILGRSVSWHPLNCVPEGSWFYQGDLWGTKQLLQLLNASEGNLHCLMKLLSKMVGNVLQT